MEGQKIDMASNIVKEKVYTGDGWGYTNGNTHLGGDDFDNAIIDYLVSEFRATNGIDLKTDKMAMQRLKEAAEKAKKRISGFNARALAIATRCC